MSKVVPLKATLRDIADGAGVSASTVSQVLNNKGAISDPTRQRVMVVVERLGYKRRGRARRVDTLTMLVRRDPSERETNPFHFFVMKGVEAQCQALGIDLRLMSIPVDEASRARSLPAGLTGRPSDGLIVVGAVVEDARAFESVVGERPFVFIDGLLEGEKTPPHSRIMVDNEGGTAEVTRYVLSRGHRNIAFVGGGEGAHPSFTERREGYTKTVSAHGLEPLGVDSLVYRLSKRDAVADLLAAGVSAVVAANDLVALEVMTLALEAGRALPETLSVTGFDNLYGAKHVRPALTTLDVDKAYLGALGVHQLTFDGAVHAQDAPYAAHHTVTRVPPKLIVRASVKAFERRQPM